MEKEKSENIQITINKKKFLKAIGCVIVVTAILVLSFVLSKNYGDNQTGFEFVNITIDEYLERMQSEEKSIIFVARPSCSYCELETPIIKQIGSQYDLTIYYLNTEDFWDSENSTYTESGEKFVNSSEKYAEGYGTPNTIIVQNGTIVDGIFQYEEKSSLIELFKNNGFINE